MSAADSPEPNPRSQPASSAPPAIPVAAATPEVVTPDVVATVISAPAPDCVTMETAGAAPAPIDAVAPCDPTPQRPVKRWIFIASLTALLLLTVISAVVLRHSILEEKINRSGAVILAVLFVLALLTTLASNEVIPWGKRSLEHWRQPRVLGALGGALLLAFSALFSLTPLLSRKEELREQHDAEQYQSVGWVVPDGLTRSMGSAGQGSVWTLSGTLFLSGDAAQIDDSTSLWLLPGSGQTWSGLDLTAALDHSAVGNLHPFATAVPPGQIEGTIVLCLLRPHPMLRPRYGVRQAFNARHVSDDRIDLVPASEPTAFPDHGAGCPP